MKAKPCPKPTRLIEFHILFLFLVHILVLIKKKFSFMQALNENHPVVTSLAASLDRHLKGAVQKTLFKTDKRFVLSSMSLTLFSFVEIIFLGTYFVVFSLY